MKKYFLVLLLSAVTFFAFSQNVTIPNKVAAWYLEQAETVVLLEKQDSISQSIINKQGQTLINKDTIISLYERIVIRKDLIILEKDSIVFNRDERIEGLVKKINNRIFQRDLAIGIGVGVGIGSFLGQPVIGGIIGAGAATVKRIF